MSPPAGYEDESTILRVRGLFKRYPGRRGGLLRRTMTWVNAVNGIDLDVKRGEVLGLVGESGCGKSTLGRCLVRSEEPSDGEIIYRSAEGKEVDLARLRTGRELRPYQSEVRVIFQDPFSALNPRMTILEIVGDPLRARGEAKGSELRDRVAAMLRKVGLAPEHMHRYPHAFSGGQRQRVNIARALITNPRLVIADEAVSALDVSIRAQVLNLLRDLRDELNLTYLFISHDMSVIENVCDRVAVMYLGRIVELADTESIYFRPRHPYTEALLSAVPRPDPRLRDKGRRIRLSDEFPDPTHLPGGCLFHTRCVYSDGETCKRVVPELVESARGAMAACHFAEELSLSGVGDVEPEGSTELGGRELANEA